MMTTLIAVDGQETAVFESWKSLPSRVCGARIRTFEQVNKHASYKALQIVSCAIARLSVWGGSMRRWGIIIFQPQPM
jgi:hypothetical protein